MNSLIVTIVVSGTAAVAALIAAIVALRKSKPEATQIFVNTAQTVAVMAREQLDRLQEEVERLTTELHEARTEITKLRIEVHRVVDLQEENKRLKEELARVRGF